MGIIKQLYSSFRNLILYGIIGCCTATLDFIVFTILSNYFGTDYIVANCIGVLTGICSSFLLNRAYNFKVKDRAGRRFAIFLSVGLAGMVLSNVILVFCIERLAMDKTVSKLLSIVLVVICQFLLNKYITFRSVRKEVTD